MKAIKYATVMISLLAAVQGGTAVAGALEPVPAAHTSIATQAYMQDAALAGERIVAVGDHGIVLLSDDQGQSYRQAADVPVSSPLNAVSFVNANEGWAVGQWGAILATEDGGNSWRVQRLDTEEDRPLFAVHFFNAQEGIAVGLWSLVLTTRDGGDNWSVQTLPAPPGSRRADLNLMGAFVDAQGRFYVTAERGKVLTSADKGVTWSYLDTGYRGTLWTGVALPDGGLLVGGQSGTLLRSDDGGQNWVQVPVATKSPINGLGSVAGGGVRVVGLDGFRAVSLDGARTFTEVDGRHVMSNVWTLLPSN